MSERDCRRCKDWHNCIAPPEWFHYGQLRWCPYQILWLLKNDKTFDDGKWPPENNRVEQSGKTQLKSEGYFVKAKLIVGELNKRMETTGTAGKLLLAQANLGESLKTIFDNLDPEAREVLMYLKGKNRKEMSFGAWKRQRRYRKMIIKT